MNAQQFLNHLFGYVPGYFELTYIDPQGYYGLDPHIRTDSYELGRDIPDWDRMDEYNAQGYSVYYSLATKKRRLRHERARASERDAWWIPCLWAEVDLKAGAYDNLDAIYNAMCDVAQPPTVIVSSGGGLHALWRITPIEVTTANFAAIKEVLRGLAVALNGDTNVAELARVFRLPGTINTKPERNGAICGVIDSLPGELTFDQFIEYRALASPVQRPIERDLPRYQPGDLPSKVTEYLNSAVASGGRNNALNVAAYIMHSNGYTQSEAERVLLPKATDTDGLGEREALRTIQSAYNAPPGQPVYVSKRAALRMRAGDALRRVRGQ